MAPTFPTADDWPRAESRTTVASRDQVLEFALSLAARVPGNIIEFGVASGASTRVLRSKLTQIQLLQRRGPKKTIFACDSFEGLPEKYENAEVGAFAGEVPSIRGVEMVVGYFDDSLTPELAARVGKVALASLDADLYSSTMTALRWLTPLLHSGSLLLFDEYVGENESEKRAHEDWAKETGVETVVIAEFARNPSGWSDTPDRRVLAQVVAAEPLDANAVAFWPRPEKIVRGLSRRARKLLQRSGN